MAIPDRHGRFGPYGGRYVPETLMPALLELEQVYQRTRRDRRFQSELKHYLKEYVGRPTPLYFAQRLTKRLGGAKIYLKREDRHRPAPVPTLTAPCPEGTGRRP